MGSDAGIIMSATSTQRTLSDFAAKAFSAGVRTELLHHVIRMSAIIGRKWCGD
jgi:hypothetical protein